MNFPNNIQTKMKENTKDFKRYLNTIYLTCNDINDINHYLHEITYGDTTKTIIIDIASIYRYNTKY